MSAWLLKRVLPASLPAPVFGQNKTLTFLSFERTQPLQLVMNVQKFEIHDVTVATTKFEVATAKIFKLELSNIHSLLLQYICCMDRRYVVTLVLVCNHEQCS
jgi:hypothetical protein